MKLKSFRCRGLTVFKDSIEINFDTMPPGLIAIVGPNGSGKTSMMDGMFGSLYRELPTRGGLYKSFSGKDGFLELAFEMGAHAYVSKVLVNAHAEDMKAFLSCDGVPLDECRQGKLAPHLKAVERIVGSLKLVLSSVFGAQDKRGNFAEMPVSERKALFVELLGLGQFPAYEKQSKANADSLERDIIRLRLEHSQAHQDQERAEQISRQILNNENDLRMVSECIRQKTTEVEELQAIEGNLAKQQSAQEAVIAEKQREQSERRQRNATAKTEAMVKLRDRQGQVAKAVAARLVAKADISLQIEDIRKRIANNEALMGRADVIRQAVCQEDGLRDRIKMLDGLWYAAMESERSHIQATANHARLVAQRDSVISRISMVEEAAEEIGQVPCRATGIYAACIKITNAVENAKILPELKSQRRELDDSVQHAAMGISANGNRPTDDILKEKTGLVRELEQVSKDAKLVEALNTTEERLLERRQALTEAMKRLEELDHPVPVDPLIDELTAQLKTLDAEALVPAEVFRLDPAIGQALDRTREELIRVKRTLDHSRNEFGRLEGAMAALRAEVERLAEAEERVAILQAQISTQERDLADWAMLGKACGPTGIPALEIDAAGPAISALVNDLLHSCFSDRFTVQLTTQKLASDGRKLLEDFAIRVIDSERGRTGTLEDLSGGEKTIVGEGLALGIALYNKGGSDLRTCFRDETTGSLSVDVAPRYIAMLRRAMNIGRFERILYITHNPECADLADAKLRCSDGKVIIER